MQSDVFLGGVVEGFYGRPWTHAQRLDLFARLADWGLNTYFYAPKDDLKHRALWRERYSEAELAPLRELLADCRRREIYFIYGLSPGLDIRFSDEAEVDLIRSRFDQLIEAGGEHFALLFDDLPGQLGDQDRRKFASVSAAQCAVANEVFRWVQSRRPDSRFLFCPTPYCDRMDRWQLAGADYLETVGRQLDPAIDVLWTGPEIVSREIPVDSIERLSARIQRKPLIWDNLHANDYDGRRAYCGPYCGRDPDLKRRLSGIVSNPHNEYPLNFVPLRTLADYLRDDDYAPRDSYQSALSQWLPAYETVGRAVSREDLGLLADCFHLPYESGPDAKVLLAAVERLVAEPVAAWGDAEATFQRLNQRVQSLFERLTELRDRELFYAWSRRAWDLKEELQLIEGYLEQKRLGRDETRVETHLPGTYRGGVVARLQALLRMEADGRFSPGDFGGG